MMLERVRIEAFLRSRGADRLAHPGGTLYAHMRRVGALLSDWGAEPVVQAAGLCHACYGTDGFAHSLLELSERAALVELIGPHAEQLVYLYGSCDRAAVYPQLPNRGQVPFRDRFTGTTHSPAEQDVRAFVELTAANELDVLLRNPAAAAAHGEGLLRLLRSARHRLSDAAWQSWRASLRPAPDTVAELEK